VDPLGARIAGAGGVWGTRRLQPEELVGGSSSRGDFPMTLAPASAPLLHGGSVSFGVTLSGVTSARSTAELSVSGVPAGVTATLVPPATAVFTVRAAVDTAAGRRAAAVTGGLTVLAGNRTALVGRIVDTERDPIPGVAIVLDQRTAVTDSNGNFLLLDLPAGEDVILIDGDPAGAPGRRYPTIPVSADAGGGPRERAAVPAASASPARAVHGGGAHAEDDRDRCRSARSEAAPRAGQRDHRLGRAARGQGVDPYRARRSVAFAPLAAGRVGDDGLHVLFRQARGRHPAPAGAVRGAE
jgi:hypothetical protein